MTASSSGWPFDQALNVAVITFIHITKQGLPPGWSAERQVVGGEWKRTKDEWTDDED